ncbi:SDR family oxidoreductase [Paraburkholderia youngii]|uniref:NAD(P)-dependent dehydrogenase (Short-subunit alcohol dehydrogenase family) n=1 Tax=Paraburkholderia youngii TaxID=2782701 RepID=A0A7W8L930_9BURK|nr:SDR family oxidoreductase [Paraburkholderia youngii]MBB5402642.1 NAD(P)-dependent dehydrogenase (short-subunit alcohol dehydrogenase family) [Paraburkholderia youngii]
MLTGAAGSLGRAFCEAYATHYDIVAIYRHRAPTTPSQQERAVDPLEPTATLTENSLPVYTVRADLTDEHDLERIVQVALARYDRIDLLVNAAGYAVWAPFDSERLRDSVEEQFAVNVIAPLKLTALVHRKFWRSRREENLAFNRSIVNVSSTASLRVYPGLGQAAYAASKAALNHLTLHLADELVRSGVRVNALAPNSFPAIVPVTRVAAAIRELDNRRLTGKILVVDRMR